MGGKDDPEEEGHSTPPYIFQISLAIRNSKNTDLKIQTSPVLNHINLKNSISVIWYLCIIPYVCFVQRVKNGTSCFFPKCDCIIIWIPKYFCVSEQQFCLSSDASSSVWSIKVRGTDSEGWDYLLSSACKSSWAKTYTGGVVYWQDPTVPFWGRENKGSENTWSLKKAKWSPRRSKG